MLKFITESEYRELLGASSIPNNFNSLVIEASYYIERETLGRIDKNNIPQEVKYCTAKIIDVINSFNTQRNEIGNLKSTNIEGWSETYNSQDEIDKNCEVEKRKILELYLCDTNLLYRGVITLG